MATDDFAELNARYAERLGMSRSEMAADRRDAEKYASEAFPDGVLGRVSTEQPADIQQFVQDRRDMVNNTQKQGQVDFDLRMRDIAGMNAEYQKLIDDRMNMKSAFNQGMRDKANQTINSELRGQLRNINSQANAGGYRGGLQQGMTNDAIGAAAYNRAQAQTDIALGSRDAAENLINQRSQMQSERLGALASENRAREESLSSMQSALENVRATSQQDTLQRELINLQNAAQERYGRLSTVEAMVNQGIAERTGVRQGLLSESQLSAQNKYQKEQLEIQRIEAEKPPPQAGGKVLCTVHWERGELSDEVYKADLAYALTLPAETIAGYHFWAKPIVRIIEKYPALGRITRPLVVAWAKHMHCLMGGSSRSFLGKIFHNIGMPMCTVIGKLIKKQSQWAKQWS